MDIKFASEQAIEKKKEKADKNIYQINIFIQKDTTREKTLF